MQLTSQGSSPIGCVMTVTQNETINLPINVTLPAGNWATGNYTFWFTIKTSYQQADPGAYQTHWTYNLGTTGPTVSTSLSVPHGSTKTITAGQYVFDLVMIDTLGNYYPILAQGIFVMFAMVTTGD